MEVGLAVGGAFLSSALNVIFDRMTPQFPSLFKGHNGADELFKKLKITLLPIRKVLSDAEDKQVTNIYVKEWLRELRKTVYEAEYLLDVISTEALRLQVEGGDQRVTNKVSHLSRKFLNKIPFKGGDQSVSNEVNHLSKRFLKKIIPKVEDVVSSLEVYASQINTLGLKDDDIERDHPFGSPTSSVVDESYFFGRDKDKERLIDMVLSDNGDDVNVIPIVGMGGLGKTTLAQFAYGDERVQKLFEKRAWVSLSENFDPLEITRTLVRKIASSPPGDKDDFDTLQVKLKESLANKKFFIVLDNVWNENYNDWDKLRTPLKNGRKDSVVLVTTRNEDVAKRMQPREMLFINRLSDKDSWSLFQKHAFHPHAASSKFEEIGKKIVNKCKGLPLAIKMVAGILHSETEIKEWNDIFGSEILTLEENKNDVLSVLELSYRHLPSELKCCFAFCAIFPKSYPFDEEELVLLWMANDLLPQSDRDDGSLKDRGHKYFSQLRSRSFFQKNNYGGYLMHDLINDLARYVCGKVCVRFEDCQRGEIPSETRYFSYVSRSGDAIEKFKALAQLKGLRTFYSDCCGRYEKLFFSDVLTGLERLRALTLCGYDINELPHSFCSLKHLRFLNLSGTCIRQLPDGICSLYNLQTLLLSRCWILYELPMNLTNLFNLHHLDLKRTNLRKMPSHMRRLKNLQTLSYFIVGNSLGESIEELGNLHLRGDLKITGLENVTSENDALKANLRNKNQLEELVLQWNGNTDDSQIASGILEKLQPNANLKSLTIDGYDGTRFPNWLSDNSLRDISSLYLTNCKNCFILPTLGHLEYLKSLTIKGLNSVAKIDEEFYGVGSSIKPFKFLTTLKIKKMSKLEKWNITRNTDFSQLEKLYIIDCPQLVLVDGLVSFPKVKRIVVEDCPSLVSLPHVGPSANLRELTIEDCPSLVSLPRLGPSANLRKLKISDCTKLEFPKGEGSEGYYNSLEELCVFNAGDSFGEISFGSFPKLLSLRIHWCESLKVFSAPSGTQNFSFLRELRISGCGNLLSFPEGGLPAPNLEHFEVFDCEKLKLLPEQMRSLLPRLRFMRMSYCPEIECFPTEGLPSGLEWLMIECCKKLMRCQRNWGLQRLVALESFYFCIDDCVESFPAEGVLPSSLTMLRIWKCKKLKTVNRKGLIHLTSLNTLYISDCPELQSLPEEGLPTSLAQLYVLSCPSLTPHLERERGKYWPIIERIPKIDLGGKFISRRAPKL